MSSLKLIPFTLFLNPSFPLSTKPVSDHLRSFFLKAGLICAGGGGIGGEGALLVQPLHKKLLWVVVVKRI